MAKNNLTFLIISIISGFLLSLFFYTAFEHPVAADALQYRRIAENLLHHGAFSLSEGPPYLPTAYRDPAYPAFLAALLFLFKENYTAVYLAQIIIFVLTVVFVFYLSSWIFGGAKARWIAFITALCPTLANYPSYLLTETLFTFLIVLFMVSVFKAVATNKTAWYVCSGFVLALGTLTKSITSLLFIPIICAGLFYCGSSGRFFKKYLKNFTVFVLVFLTFIAPWLMRNYSEFGKFSLGRRFGSALWMRSVKLDYDIEDIKKEAVFSFSEYLGKKMYPDVEEPNRFLLKELRIGEEKVRELSLQGYNESEIDHIQTKEALTRIYLHPFRYLSQGLLETLKMAAFLYIPMLNEPHMIEKFGQIKNGRLFLSGLRGAFRLLAYIVLIFAFFGFWGERKKWRQWIFIAVLIIYMNLCYSLLSAWGRYSVPLIPFYFMFAVAGFTFIKKRKRL